MIISLHFVENVLMICLRDIVLFVTKPTLTWERFFAVLISRFFSDKKYIYVVMNVAQGYYLKSQKGGVLPKHTSLWQVLYKQVYNSDKGLDIDRI